jgi:hypothetical protein
MPERQKFTLNLRSDSEAVRRALYDAVVAIQFSPVPGAGGEDYAGPAFTPDECGLQVFKVFGRWFATWTEMDEPGLPEDQQQVLLRIVTSEDSPSGLLFEEV